MTDKKIITKYIKCSFELSSLNLSWCVKDISNGHKFHLSILTKHLERLFPNMGSEPIAKFWYEQSMLIVSNKMTKYLDNYSLKEGHGRKAWDVVNKFGKILDMNDLYEFVPYPDHGRIDELFDEWLMTAKEIATERLING